MKQGKPYFELVASIIYAPTMTRPDIAYHTSMLSRFMPSPSVDCYPCAEELLNYLYSTKDKAHVLGGRNIFLPHFDTLCDAGAKESTPTTSRSVLQATMASTSTLTHPGRPTTPTLRNSTGTPAFPKLTPVPAKLRLQPVVLLPRRTPSSAIFSRGHLLDVIGTKLSSGATVLLMDNSAAVEQADHASASKKTEHYKRWEYYLRKC
eukprot:4711918-Pleurochrysis_carterae.AAC.1